MTRVDAFDALYLAVVVATVTAGAGYQFGAGIDLTVMLSALIGMNVVLIARGIRAARERRRRA